LAQRHAEPLLKRPALHDPQPSMTMTDRYSFTSAPRPRLRELSPLQDIMQRMSFVVVAVVFINLITMRYRVEGPSMEPTLENGQILVLNRLAYMFGPPARGDITVLHLSSLGSEDLIKRIVGLPGETLEIRDSHVSINGKPLETPWGLDCGACAPGIWVLGPQEYFLLGDHREASRDSRSFGPVPASALIGKVIWRYWPITQFGPVS
jgi:signal peptidase I